MVFMTYPGAAILLTILLSTIGVAGEYFIKLASQTQRPFLTGTFALGLALIAATAFGGVIVMRHLKLASLASVYCAWTILLLTLIGRFSFAEKLNFSEMAGVFCAVASVLLLFRFN
jgi:undecaprenyl phosphate-alpha-L-ara4N flippase subunit ArnF